MNKLKIFKNKEFGEIRTIEIEGTPYFVGKDVAEILGYSNPRDAISKHVDVDDKNTVAIHDGIGNPNKTIINESGLYSLILSSKLPKAKQFKHWVTSEVLPSIRKHGVYAVDELLNNPDMAIKAFEALKAEREKNKVLTADVQRMKPKEIFADAVSASQTSILVGDLAKLIAQNGVSIGQKRLFEWLRKNKYLISRKGAEWNMPTQRSVEQGLFEIKETSITHADGHITVNKTAKVTGKGQIYFVNKFVKEKENEQDC